PAPARLPPAHPQGPGGHRGRLRPPRPDASPRHRRGAQPRVPLCRGPRGVGLPPHRQPSEVLNTMEGSGSLVFLVLMVGVFYFLLIRPQQRRMKALQSLQSSLQLGDEIVTSAGFFGTIRRFDGEVVTIELSPGVEARVNRRAISGKVTPEPAGEVAEVVDEEEERPER